jgi:hypothetical protein
MSRKTVGVGLAANHAERALGRARGAEPGSEKRLGAVIEAAWWLAAGWEAAGKPSGDSADALLLGFSWIRNRSIHDVGMLVRGYGGYSDGYGGSPPPVAKTADLYSDKYTDDYLLTEVWGSADEIRPFLTEEDKSSEASRAAYASYLAGQPIDQTIDCAVTRLRALPGALR